MPIYSNQFTVEPATAIEIVAPDVEAQEAWIHDNANSQNRKLFIGHSGVTASNGFRLLSGETQKFMIPPNDTLYAISTGGDINVHVMRVTQH